MQAPVFALASQVFGDDTDKIVRALPSTSLRLQIALNLINGGKSDDALRIVRHRLSERSTIESRGSPNRW